MRCRQMRYHMHQQHTALAFMNDGQGGYYAKSDNQFRDSSQPTIGQVCRD